MELKDINYFIQYCFDFYGKDGVWPLGATENQIAKALCIHLADDSRPEFCGDTVDRERVRDILMEQFKLVKLN
jgi:hypothetical protein